MTKTEQIRLMTAMLCGPNILDSARPDDFIREAKKIAEKVYDAIEDPVTLVKE